MPVDPPVLTLFMIRYILSRVGCFMVLVGSIFLMVGIAALKSDQAAGNQLFIGLLVFCSGFLLWHKLRPKKPRAARFSLFRKKDNSQEPRADRSWEDRYDD